MATWLRLSDFSNFGSSWSTIWLTCDILRRSESISVEIGRLFSRVETLEKEVSGVRELKQTIVQLQEKVSKLEHDLKEERLKRRRISKSGKA